MLELEDVTVDYGTTRALDRVSLTVGENEIVALLGANGAGKTSLLRAATGLVPYGGSIRFDGDEVHRLGTEEAARRGLVHVPEGRHVFPTLSVHENLQIGLQARGRRPAGRSIDDCYDLFPALVPLRGRLGWALSGGEQQMVAVARALVAAPRMLLLDEPSLGLAPIVVAAVYQALEQVARTVPLLIVEQSTATVLRIATRAAVLHEGRIVLEGTPAELDDRSLLGSYLGQSTLA